MYLPHTLHSTGKSQYLLLHCKAKIQRKHCNKCYRVKVMRDVGFQGANDSRAMDYTSTSFGKNLQPF